MKVHHGDNRPTTRSSKAMLGKQKMTVYKDQKVDKYNKKKIIKLDLQN